MIKTFFKSDIIENINPSSDNNIRVDELLQKKQLKNIKKNTSYLLINRNEYIKEAIRTINSNYKKILFINGFCGSGKTLFVKTLFSLLEDFVLRFYYDCSAVTNLDDIIVSLYTYLNSILSKNPEFLKNEKITQNPSIDRKLIEYLKSLKRPIIIAIDSFEHLTDKNFNLNDNEIAKFLNYLTKFPNIKLIISSQKLLLSGLNLNENNSFSIKLGGLDDTHAVMLLKDNNINAFESTLYQAYEATRGYPESLFLLINGIQNLNTNVFDLISEYSTGQNAFEEFIYKKLYNLIPQECLKLCKFLSTIRHPIKAELIKKLNLIDNVEDNLKLLTEKMILSQNDENYYLKTIINDLIYSQIHFSEKTKIHNFLHEFYSGQIPKPLTERDVTLSRKLLHSEQYYHYKIASKFKTNLNILTANPNQYFEFKNTAQPSLPRQSKQEDKNNEAKKIEENILNIEDNEEDNIEVDNKFKKKLIETIQEMDDDDLGIELSEEERKLLEGTTSDENTDNENYNNDKLIIPIFFEEEENKTESQEKTLSPIEQKLELIQKAKSFKSENKLDLALKEYKKALELSKLLSDKKQTAEIYSNMANILTEMHKFEEAGKYYNTAIEYFELENDYLSANKISNILGNAYIESYKHDDAIKIFRKVITEKKEHTNKQVLAEAYSGLAEIYDYRRTPELAVKYYLLAYENAIKEKNDKLISSIAFKLALVYDDMGKVNKALEFYKKCANISETNKNPYIAEALANIAAIYEENNNLDNAVNFYLKSLEIDKTNKNFDGEYKTLLKLANIYLFTNNKHKALEYILEGLETAKLSGDIYLIAGSLFELGDFYLNAKDYEKAVKNFILSKKTIGATISTDSSEKIDRKIRQIVEEIGETRFNIIIERLKHSKGR